MRSVNPHLSCTPRKASRSRGAWTLGQYPVEAIAIVLGGGFDHSTHSLHDDSADETAHRMSRPSSQSHDLAPGCTSRLTDQSEDSGGLAAFPDHRLGRAPVPVSGGGGGEGGRFRDGKHG